MPEPGFYKSWAVKPGGSELPASCLQIGLIFDRRGAELGGGLPASDRD